MPAKNNCFKTLLAAALPILLILAAAAPSWGAKRNITKTKLPNGLTVIIEEDKSAPVVAVQAWVNTGAADEIGDEAGLAHVFEHMLFKGTAKRGVGEIAGEIESAGGDVNAYTSFDNTVYHTTVPARSFSTGLDVIADALQNSAFDPSELDKELKVVLEEISMNEDNPGRLLYKKTLSTAYSKHPYGRPVIGYEDTVSKFTREKVVGFFKKWYTPDNIILVIAGDVDTKTAIEKVTAAFNGFKASPEQGARSERTPEPEQTAPRTVVEYKPINETHLTLAFHIPSVNHKDVYPIDVIQVILGDGVTSRLYKRLKMDEQLVYGVSAYSMTPKDPGLFLVSLRLDAAKVSQAIIASIGEIERLKRDGPTPRELEKAKLQLESDFIYQRETMDGKASQLGYYESAAGDLSFEEKYIEGVRSVTAEDVKATLVKYFTAENSTVAAIVPEAQKNTLDEYFAVSKTSKDKGKKQGDKEALGNALAFAYAVAGKDTPPKTAAPSAVIKEKLPNGITLLVMEDHSNETVSVYATVKGGLLYETASNNGIGSFTASMLTRGTLKRSFEDIGRETEDTAASIGGFSGRTTAGLSGTFLSKYFDRGFELFTDVLFNASFPEEEIEKVRKDTVAAIKRDEDYLPGYTFKLLYKDLFSDHPYSMPVKGSIDTVNKFKKKELVDYYKSVYTPGGMVIAVVGDMDSKAFIENARKKLGSFQGRRSNSAMKGKPVSITAVKTTGAAKDKEQLNIGIGFAGPSMYDRDVYVMTVLNEILSSQGGRLFVELRDKQSLAYAVSSFLVPAPDTGAFGVYIGSAPEKKDAAISGILKELDKAVKDGVTDEEIAKAKRSIVGQFEMGLQGASSMASNMATNAILGFGHEFYKEYPGIIESVTREEILKASKKYITTGKYVISIVGPDGKKKTAAPKPKAH
ncbi:MAG: insulinase family protein [Deltaproteobacteria bacterium]|nr:insulinase family protein [Deltaproteobacteria bacterium]